MREPQSDRTSDAVSAAEETRARTATNNHNKTSWRMNKTRLKIITELLNAKSRGRMVFERRIPTLTKAAGTREQSNAL